MKDSTAVPSSFSLEEWINNPLKDAEISEDILEVDWMQNSGDKSEPFDSINDTYEEAGEAYEIEWVNEELGEQRTLTLKQRRILGNLYYHWRSYKDNSGQGGEVYNHVPCRTKIKGRSPDVAYITPQLAEHFGDLEVFPQSFPLIAEVASPADLAEELIAKSHEYLRSGSEEVWLIFPENRWIIIITENQKLIFGSGDIVYTQRLLNGFSVEVDELLG
ncbi:MAG: Uma2 family endonuclease [Rivularia sp. (in: cyanobacteria)]